MWEETCAVCGEFLPQRGNRRVPIPWKGGQRRLIHAACKPKVDDQTVLELEPVSIGALVLGHERRPELRRLGR